MNKKEYFKAQEKTLLYLNKAAIILTEEEKARIEVADFGLNRLEEIGLQLITYVNGRVCAKELVLFARQTCPEHRHPPINGLTGKEETFRCRWGKVYLYVPGETNFELNCILPKGNEKYYTARQEIELNPGEQYTLAPNTLHWFQAGPEGAIVSEISTTSRDKDDIFTNPEIKRIPKLEE